MLTWSIQYLRSPELSECIVATKLLLLNKVQITDRHILSKITTIKVEVEQELEQSVSVLVKVNERRKGFNL